MGEIRAWRVVELPATGQISNVSALVMPRRAGMPDHEQEPMFPELDKLLEITRGLVQLEALRLQRAATKAARKSHKGPDPPAPRRPPQTRGKHVPQIKEHRTYVGFRKYMQDQERELADHGDPVTLEAIWSNGGPSARTLGRTMEDYGLRPKIDWPPRIWPEDPPNGQKKILS